jgi:hypothetical protein
MRESLNKQGQLAVVIVGFFATVQVLAAQLGVGAPFTRVLLTLIIALAFAVRYWWVILILPWPFQWFRLALILSAWTLLPFIGSFTSDVRHWVLGLAALSAVGFVTEVFGWLTEQYRVGSPEMTRSLKREHVWGAAAAGVTAVVLGVVASIWTPQALEWFVLALVVADWVRLIMMIRRYDRMPTMGAAT